jgi:diaminopropionate ammonia-lyase
MFTPNLHPDRGLPLDPVDVALLGRAGSDAVERHLARRPDHAPTPLVALPGLAARLGVGAIHLKDESRRLGLGSFKALGGAYAVACLVREAVAAALGLSLDEVALDAPEARAVAAGMTFACATDGNHGRSVAQGAALAGARSAIFVHAGVSPARVAAIESFGAQVIRVAGSYDDSVREAARVAARQGWTVVSDTAWPGYERIPGLVMQGYGALVAEALRQLPAPPTHVFVQAGVGGIAAAVAARMALTFGRDRPVFTVVEPARAACLLASARALRPVVIPQGEPTVMAMLECYEPSPLAWRVLSRAADAFMAVEEEDAVAAMRRLAEPLAGDPALAAGESGGVGLAGLMRALADPAIAATLRLDRTSRVFAVITEGATDPQTYERLVGRAPEAVAAHISAPALRFS